MRPKDGSSATSSLGAAVARFISPREGAGGGGGEGDGLIPWWV